MVVVTGGFVTTAAGLRISARSPLPAFLIAFSSLLAWAALAQRAQALAADLDAVDRQVRRHTRAILLTVAVAACAVAAAFHSFSATGADASGYLSFARTLSAGALVHEEPLAAVASWTHGPATLAPLGWRAAPEPGLQVPTYAIGLPLLLAPLHAVGGAVAASFVIPATFAVAVAVVGALACRIGGPSAALIASIWLATSPIALVESMQVMSDVPVTAAWLACWWLAFARRPAWAGLAAAVAILIRPNLAPLAAVPLLAILTAERRLPRALQFAIPVAVAGSLVAYLQWRFFGSPMRSGYGTAEEIYAASNVVPNSRLYLTWLLDTHGPWLLASPAAFLVANRTYEGHITSRQQLAWLFAFAVLVVVAYLVYARFETWTYLRFMLPAMAVGMVACAALLARGLDGMRAHLRVPASAVLVLAIAAMNVSSARHQGVFRVADQQARARSVGERLAATLPVNAAIVSGEQSGSMRYYTDRPIIRWDLIDAPALPEAIERLSLNGYEVWVVLDDWEEEAFRRKFPAFASASIDYAPAVESAAGVGIRTRAWRARVFSAGSSNLPVGPAPAVSYSEARPSSRGVVGTVSGPFSVQTA